MFKTKTSDIKTKLFMPNVKNSESVFI